jgi:hypothetical protein
VFYLDVYPFENVLLLFILEMITWKKLIFVADPDVAEKVTRELPKSPTYAASWAVIGPRSIVSINGSMTQALING